MLPPFSPGFVLHAGAGGGGVCVCVCAYTPPLHKRRMVADDMETDAQGFVLPHGSDVTPVPGANGSVHQVRFEQLDEVFDSTCTRCHNAFGAMLDEVHYLAACCHFNTLSCHP